MNQQQQQQQQKQQQQQQQQQQQILQSPTTPSIIQTEGHAQQPQTIKLSTVIHRLVQDSYDNLVGLTAVSPSLKDVDKKRALIDYFDQTREKFLRLLVILKWSSHIETLTKANDIIQLLEKEDSFFREAADLLIMTKENLINARAPIYDIPTAVDVMTSGTYQRMPANIGLVLPPPVLSKTEISRAIDKLNNIIGYKLFLSDVPSEFEPIRVENGRAHLVVKNEYEAFLTIDGAGVSNGWLLISFNLFIYSQQLKEGKGPIKIRVDERVKEVTERIQNRLIHSKQPLHELHNIIHSLVVAAQLDSLSSQMDALKKTAFKSNIKCVHGKDLSLTIFFWISEEIASSVGSLDVKKHMNIKIYIDDSNKLHVSYTPNIPNPRSDSSPRIPSLNIETILMRAMELHAHIRVQHLYNVLFDDYLSKLKQQQVASGNSNNTKSFQINDFKLIYSSQQQQQQQQTMTTPSPTNTNTTKNEHNIVTSTDDSLPTILRVQLYGSNYLDITVNQLTGRFNIILSSSKNHELIAPFEAKLNSAYLEIKSIVNIFKLKSLLSCFEEAALFMRLECFYKIPLVSQLFTDQNYICIRFPKYKDVYYLVISIHPTTFLPIFHLIYSKPSVNSAIVSSESQVKRIECTELHGLVKDCEHVSSIHQMLQQVQQKHGSSQSQQHFQQLSQSVSQLQQQHSSGAPHQPQQQQFIEQSKQFQAGVCRLLKRLYEIAKFQINLSSVVQHMHNNAGVYYQVGDDHVKFNFTQPLLPDPLIKATDHMVITFPNDNHCRVEFTELSPFSELKNITNKHISYTTDGNWSFTYDTATDWLTSFKNDLIAINKIINLASQLVKQLRISKEFQTSFQILSIKPKEIEFICLNYSLSKSTIKIFVNKQNQIVLDYQPFVNPLLPFFEKELNESMNMENFLNAIAISNEIVFSIQAIIYTPNNSASQFLPLEIFVIPRSSTQIRLVYRNLYGIDIRFVSTDNCIVEDGYYSNVMGHQYPQQYRTKLMAIPYFHLIMEHRINVVALDNQGFRSSWLVPMKQFRASLQRIVLFMSCTYLFNVLRSAVKVEFNDIMHQTLTLRFSSETIQFHLSVRDYSTFELDASNKLGAATQSGLTKTDFDTLSMYFKKKINGASYRSQTIASIISILNVPPAVLIELLKILRGDQEHQQQHKYVVDICLSASSSHLVREPFIHKRDLHSVFMSLRFFSRTSQPVLGLSELFVDLPITHNYQTNQIYFWNRNEPIAQFDPNKVNTAQLTPSDQNKYKVVELIKQSIQAEAGTEKPSILSQFAKNLHRFTDQLIVPSIPSKISK